MDYKNDNNARYLAMRVIQNKSHPQQGLLYGKAITSKLTTREAIDYWIDYFTLNKEV